MQNNSEQLKILINEFTSMSAEISDKHNYWKFFDKYRAKKEELKIHIQTEFKRWRKALRALEMKVLDQLHNSSFAQFEEAFHKAKEGNQKLLNDITEMQNMASRLVNNYEAQSQHNKHFISFELTDTDEIEMLLTKGEAMFDIVISDIEFKQLAGLDSQYNQIKVIFDPSFEQRASQMVKLNNWLKVDQNRSNELSADLTNAESSLMLPSSV